MRYSIIIPTLNEAGQIAHAIAQARALGDVEIIVVDGGSNDETLSASLGADQVLTAERGRAAQQNAGAAASRGDVLLFLHADCWLGPGALEQMASALAESGCVGGYFRQAIEAAGRRFRWLERGNALRAGLLGLPYGDQGIFARREIFNKLGGFPPLALMEDLYFMKRLRREGSLARVAGPLHVSARRWEKHGVVRQTARNWCITLLAQLGFSPNRLSRFYPDVR
ncbi:MAG TPA: TIGR04283 family arsenosugar biosynthesis glycosyltransferase [Planctomycetaceae bacterium]|nr:TIGR04283 family arsenosugar biosynthesis glycosyltransferase [Planctomycetaceae bacterium]